VQAQTVESGSMLVGMELGVQQVDVKLGRVWMEIVQVEWAAGKLKLELTMEAVWVMKVKLEQRLGLMEVNVANGTTGVESGEVKLG